MRLILNEAEWQVILAAYLYEVEDDPVISDATYDLYCEFVASQKSINIPGFDRSTGQWVHKVVELYPEIKNYAQLIRKLGEGTSIVNVIPAEYIKGFE